MAGVRCVRCGGRITADGVHLNSRKARACAGILVRQLGMPKYADDGFQQDFICPVCGSRGEFDYDVQEDFYICGCGCKFRISARPETPAPTRTADTTILSLFSRMSEMRWEAEREFWGSGQVVSRFNSIGSQLLALAGEIAKSVKTETAEMVRENAKRLSVAGDRKAIEETMYELAMSEDKLWEEISERLRGEK
jgi:hypothetical protein